MGMPVLFAAFAAAGQTPTPAHVAAVKTAQGAAYAITDATNGCPVVGTDMFGWPGGSIRKCIYKEGPASKPLTGLAYLLEVKPETIAAWIETSCAQLLPGTPGCFNTVLTCGRNNSGMMFAISGNILENMNPTTWKNYFFRNGMTVAIGGEKNGTTKQVPLTRQEDLATMPDTKIDSIPSGLTRYWRTLPKQFATRFPKEGAPTSLNSAQARQKWLDIARAEFLAALKSPTNRLLEAWMAAHPVTLAAGKCPEDKDP
jgi:hypothetical protein